MSTTELILKNGQKVKIDTKLSLGAMRKAFAEQTITREMLIKFGELVNSNTSGVGMLDGMNMDEIFGAPYLAYANANLDGMSREEFEDLLDPDIAMCGTIYAEIISNLSPAQSEMAKSFQNATRKTQGNNNSNKKKYQK